MRVGRMTALGALLLLAVAGAQAQEIDTDEGASTTATWTFTAPKVHAEDPLAATESPLAEPASQSPPVEADRLQEEASKTASSAAARLDAAVQDTLAGMDLDRIQEEVDRTVADAQDSLPPITEGSEEPAPESDEPDMTPQSTVTEAWPDVAPPLLLAAGTAAGLGLLVWFAGNSASVGAGAAGTAAASQGRRFLPYASPLFTRFEKDTVLGHPKREAIYGQIVEKPGVTLQDLCDGSGLSRTAVSHHLRLLEQQHLIISKRVGRSRHFFENGGRYGRDQKDAYAVLHNDRSKDIHSYIESNPGAIQKDLCRALGIQASVAHWHVKRLKEANLIEAVRQGRTVSYFPAQCLDRRAAFA